jgi:nucleoid DNA-binding protein
MAADEGGGEPIFISVSEDIAVKDENDQMIVSTIQPLNKEEIAIAYPIDVPSPKMLTDSTELSGVTLEANQIEVVVETIERSKELGSGTKIAFSFPGIGQFEFEKKPQKEVRTIKKAIYRKLKE